PFCHARRLQIAGGARLLPPAGGQRPLFLNAQEIRPGRQHPQRHYSVGSCPGLERCHNAVSGGGVEQGFSPASIAYKHFGFSRAVISADEPAAPAILFRIMAFLRFLMLLALIVWIGGIIFFAFVEAPTLFAILPTTRMAGDVVSASLAKLHWMGLVS